MSRNLIAGGRYSMAMVLRRLKLLFGRYDCLQNQLIFYKKRHIPDETTQKLLIMRNSLIMVYDSAPQSGHPRQITILSHYLRMQ